MRGRGSKGQGGFTLLELLIAFVIMAISLGMLYRAAGGSVRSAGEVERYQRALVLADSLLALRDAVPAEGWSESGSSAGYSWQVTSGPYPTGVDSPRSMPLHEVGIVVAWMDGSRTRNLTLHTLRPQRKPPQPGAPL